MPDVVSSVLDDLFGSGTKEPDDITRGLDDVFADDAQHVSRPPAVIGVPGTAAAVSNPMPPSPPNLAQGATPSQIAAGFMRGIPAIQEQIGGAQAMMGGFVPDALGGDALVRGGEAWMAQGREQRQAMPAPQGFLGQLAESVPSFLAAGAAGAATMGAGAIPAVAVGATAAGAQTGGQQYSDAQQRMQQMGASPEQASSIAAAESMPVAIFSAVTNTVPFMRYASRYMPGAVNKAAAKVLSQGPVRRLIGDMIAEGTQEGSEQIAQMVMQRIAEDDPEAYQDFWSQVGTAAAGGALLAPVGGGALEVVTRGERHSANHAQQQKAIDDAAATIQKAGGSLRVNGEQIVSNGRVTASDGQTVSGTPSTEPVQEPAFITALRQKLAEPDAAEADAATDAVAPAVQPAVTPVAEEVVQQGPGEVASAPSPSDETGPGVATAEGEQVQEPHEPTVAYQPPAPVSSPPPSAESVTSERGAGGAEQRIAAIDARIEELKARMAQGAPKGKGFKGSRRGAADFGAIIDAAHLAGLYTLRLGVKTAEAVKHAFRTWIAEVRPDLSEHAAEIERQTRALLEGNPDERGLAQRVNELKAQHASRTLTTEQTETVTEKPQGRARQALIDAAAVVAWEATKNGPQTAKSLGEAIDAAVAKVASNAPLLRGKADEVARVARGMIRDTGKAMRDPKGVSGPELQGFRRGVRDRIARVIEQTHATTTEEEAKRVARAAQRREAAARLASLPPDRQVSERAALRGRMKAQEGLAAKLTTQAGKELRAAVRQERRNNVQDAQRLLADLQQQARTAAKRARQMSKIEQRGAAEAATAKEKTKVKTAEEFRKEAVALIRDHAPRSVAGRYLEAAGKANTLLQVLKLLGRVRSDVADVQLRTQLKDTAKAITRADSRRMLEEHRQMVTEAKKLLRAIKAERSKLKTVAQKLDAVEQARNAQSMAVEASHRQRADEQVIVGNKVKKREAIVRKGVEALKNRKQIAARPGLSETRQPGLIGRAHYANLSPDGIGALMLDPDVRRLISEDMWDGETSVHADRMKAMDVLRSLLKEAGYTWGSDELQRLSRSAAGRQADVLTLNLPDAGKIDATPGEWMGLLATATDQEARYSIMDGRGVTWERDRRMAPIVLTADDVEAMEAQIPENLRKVVSGAKAFIEKEVRPGVFRAFREQTGYDLRKVAQYWPTHANREQPPEGNLINAKPWTVRVALEKLGFLKEREGVGAPYLVRDFFKEFHDHTFQAAAVTHMTRRVRSAENVFGDKRMKLAIEKAFGEPMNRAISQVIEASKLINREPARPLEWLTQWVNRNYAKSKLLLNPKTWLKQVGGVFKLLTEVDFKHWNKGVARMFSKEVSQILSEGAYYRNRYEDSIWRRVTPALGERGPLLGQAGVLDTAKRLITGGRTDGGLLAKTWGQVSTRYGALADLVDSIAVLNWFDSLSARVAIGAAMAKAEDANIPEASRREFIERESEYAMRRTQNGHSALEMSNLARESRGNLLSSFLMFTSDNNKTYNMMVSAWNSGDKVKFAKAVAAAGLNAAWGALVAALFSGLRDRDPKKAAEAAVRDAANNTVGVPYFGPLAVDAADAVYKTFTGRASLSGPKVLDAPIASSAEDVAKALTTLAKGMASEGEFKTGRRKGQAKRAAYLWEGGEQAALVASDLLGIPVGPVYQLAKNMIRSGGQRK